MKLLNTLYFLLLAPCFLLLAFSSHLSASQFPFQESRPLYVGSRPLGMGNTYVSLADEGEAGFWNPAGLIQWQGVKVFASAKAFNRQEYAFDSKGVAYSYRDIGFFWGNKIALRVEPDVSDFTYYSLAGKLNPYLAIGGSVKFEREHPSDYYQFFGHSPGYDFGLLCKPNPSNSIGLLIQNNNKGKYWINDLVLGYTYRMNKMLLSIDLSANVGRNAVSSYNLEQHIGFEWQIIHRLAFRAGISDNAPTAGIGLKISMLCFDYAWIHNESGNAHFISGQVSL